MSRPNRCIKDENGEELWISRSSVVIPIVFRLNKETGDIYTLVEKRGKTVTHTGEWCCPCGYLDWDESLEEACLREVREETGLVLDIKNIFFFDTSTNKYSKNQSVDHWFMCWAEYEKNFDLDKVETKDEILELRWLKVGNLSVKFSLFPKLKNHTCKIYKKSIYDCFGVWAFKYHKDYIIKMLNKAFGDSKNGDWKVIEVNE